MTTTSKILNSKILIIDDNEANIDLLMVLLEATGYSNIKYSTNPLLVPDIFISFEPDIILLDLMMPEMDGFEVMAKLHELIPADTYLPIIILTADINVLSRQKALAGGAKDFLSKPFDLNEVSLRIRNLLETRCLHQKLQRQNDQLAEIVAKRTKQLENAYEEVMKANAELETLEKAKLEFLSIISHEIRTPLNGILGFTDIIKNTTDSPVLLEYINYLQLSAQRLETFSYQALLITELRTKTYQLELSSVSIIDTFTVSKMQLITAAKSKNLSLKLELKSGITHIFADAKLLQICFNILIDNAIKYSSENSDIIIKTEETKDSNIIEFIDYGVGFSAHAINNLFSLFGVGDKHVNKNTGLSLATVKLIMDAHQADIKVVNLEPNGASVKLIFSKITTNQPPA